MISANAELTNILYSLESHVPKIDDYRPPSNFLIKFNNVLVNEHLESPLVYNFKNFYFNGISHFLSNIDFVFFF